MAECATEPFLTPAFSGSSGRIHIVGAWFFQNDDYLANIQAPLYRLFLNHYSFKSGRPFVLARLFAITLPSIGGLAGFSGYAYSAQPDGQAETGNGEKLSLIVSPYAYHWSDSETHRNVYLIGLETKRDDGRLLGLDLFRNSFGQPSVYAYYGKEWDGAFDHPELFFKLSGGVIYGYKGQYANKIPFNHHGFGLVVIPAAGWKFDSANAVQVGMLGSAALIFTYNHGF